MFQVFTMPNNVVATFDNLDAAIRDARLLNQQTESNRFGVQQTGTDTTNWLTPSRWEADSIVVEEYNGYARLLDDYNPGTTEHSRAVWREHKQESAARYNAQQQTKRTLRPVA